MSRAWLDSLSEDWVSQPGSDASPKSTHASLPNAAADLAAAMSKDNSARKPRRNLSSKNATTDSNDSSAVLSERSANDINIRALQRTPSKLSQEIRPHQRGRNASRSVSASTAGSVIHNTVQHKSLSASPARDKGQTPEWKRRLVYGELAYGEHRDLFSSAGTGLENIFKPPPVAPPDTIDEQDEDEQMPENETTMPSSPPIRRHVDSFDVYVDESAVQEMRDQPGPRGRNVRGGSVDEDFTGLSRTTESLLRDNSAFPEGQSQISVTTMSQLHPAKAELRMVSGQSVIRNEDFSPIMITRRNGDDGKVSYAPTELPVNELRQKLEKLRRNQMVLEDGSVFMDTQPNIVDNTEDYEKLGGFINFQRGGRSVEGSFRHRLLSSVIATDTSEMLPEESLQASTPKQFPTVRIDQFELGDSRSGSASPPMPLPPHPSPEKRRPPTQDSPSSPLKLFGLYDTFTNQTLLRRISQFEEDMTNSSRSRHSVVSNEPSKSGVNEAFVASPHKTRRAAGHSQQSVRSASQFGGGELDGYEFNDEISYNSYEDSAFGNEKEVEDVTGASKIFPPAKLGAAQNSSPPDVEQLVVSRRGPKSFSSISLKGSTNFAAGAVSHSRVGSLALSNAFDAPATPKKFDLGSEGKRLRASPSKDPTPKRRRTLHKSDIAYSLDEQQAESAQLSHQQMQSIIGKRRDVRPGDLLQTVDADALAGRHILRPGAYTPSQSSSIQLEEYPFLEMDENSQEGGNVLTAREDGASRHFETPDAQRKPSIRTEDFINEANKVMAIIRSKAGLRSGLGSVEESDAENGKAGEPSQDSFEESTQEPFSRPPSREGRPLPRVAARQEDPELVKQLKKYEEQSDMGDIISSSLRSMSLAKQAIQAARVTDQQIKDTMANGAITIEGEEEIISDPPNIRITSNPLRHRRSSDGSNGFASMRSEYETYSSHGSSGHSTNRTIHTGSSRGSDSRRMIAPESVSHLIGDQVGNMVFDKNRQIWVKRKAVHVNRSKQNILPSEGSEDDPFASIPDLTVDTTIEMQNLKMMTWQKNPDFQQNQAAAEESTGLSSSKATPVKSGRSQKAMSPAKCSPSRSPSKMIKKFAETQEEEDVEHEITIHEDRITEATPKRRNLTIAFSSPIASIIDDFNRENMANQQDESVGMESPDEDMAEEPLARGGRQVSSKSQSVKTSQFRSVSRGPTRHISVGGQAFAPRPISRIEERDEDSMVLDRVQTANQELSIVGDNSVVEHVPAEKRRTSLSFIVSTPARPTAASSPGKSNVARLIGEYVGRLSLSPLSDFTAHPADQSCGFEVSYIIGDRRYVTGDGSKRVLSTSLRELVDRLTEVEPFEPYWEQMRGLDISNKQLSSLHKLEEFCRRVENLDASHNEIRNLNGVPGSVRHLKITHNRLSELTAWGHLMNLQYIDISNNDVKSLSALKNLVHLREVKADNNGITSLDGIKDHDALQVVRARGNLIEELDCQDTKLQRLVGLDLAGNWIKRVANIDQLSSLATLNLANNKLEHFEPVTKKAFLSLRHLDLSDNDLSLLDVKLLPSLRVLHADRNCLGKLTGLSKTTRLDSLSLREQRGPGPLDMSFLSAAYEMRKLFISGNLIESFSPTADFLNLQLLELANCGLRSLPADLGQMMPNLRKANVNFNALADVSPFRYVPRLKKLLAAGNRLGDATGLIEVVAEFPHLAQLDLRDNPITQGFYSPLGLVAAATNSAKDREESFKLPDADAEKDAAYCRRLDLQTRMRRRLYEELFASSCRRLKNLDGLDLRRKQDTGDNDTVWTALAAHGLVVSESGSQVEREGLEKVDGDKVIENEKSRILRPWGVEDSFA